MWVDINAFVDHFSNNIIITLLVLLHFFIMLIYFIRLILGFVLHSLLDNI